MEIAENRLQRFRMEVGAKKAKGGENCAIVSETPLKQARNKMR